MWHLPLHIENMYFFIKHQCQLDREQTQILAGDFWLTLINSSNASPPSMNIALTLVYYQNWNGNVTLTNVSSIASHEIVILLSSKPGCDFYSKHKIAMQSTKAYKNINYHLNNIRSIQRFLREEAACSIIDIFFTSPWSRRQMEIFSALLALCEGNLAVTVGFPSQRPVRRSFDGFFDLRLNKWLSKQSRLRWFETPSRSSWRHANADWRQPTVWWMYNRRVLSRNSSVCKTQQPD